MSFFSQKEYLDNLRSMEQMQLKGDAPMLSRPSSPEKKLTIRLKDIPEATPGPNAFAQQARRVDRHRLDGNAFYQQEVQRRMVTPPTGVHPALRTRSNSNPPSPPRESSCTTMSPFLNAGKENSPPLKLVPDEAHMAEPTQRGLIEERREQFLHEQSGSEEERTPVFIPTPKMASSSDFAKGSATPKKNAKEATIAEMPAKTPKKGLLERLRITTNLRGSASPSMSTLGTVQESDTGEGLPAKAQAVLGASTTKSRTSLGSSPSKSQIPRSPSKRKGFFSRKNSNISDPNASKASFTRSSIDTEQAPPTASTITKTPPTAFSDPTHYSYQSKRTASQTLSDQGANNERGVQKCTIARSQSLKYFDHSIPPTPPAKNTPPNEKNKKEAALTNKSSRLPFHDDETTPQKPLMGIVSTSDRLSPTKFGNYGHRETPTLITKPSVYSLHASVVPNLVEPTTFEEMKARIDGLGLEGFSTPQETTRSPKPDNFYSPSIYSTDWGARPNSVFMRSSPAIPQISHHTTPSSHTKASSSGGEIPVYYPELAKDPSVSNIAPLIDGANTAEDRGRPDKIHLDPKTPWHGRTHSRDHSPNPRLSHDSSIFAHHVDNSQDEQFYDSPTSFSHPSATPSPLQFLLTAAYTPPPRKSSKPDDMVQKPEKHGRTSFTQASDGLVIHGHHRSNSASPSRRNELFDNAPSLRAQSSHAGSRTPSPQANFKGDPFEDLVDVDPQKPSPAKSPSTDKLDQMLEMLNKLNVRNNEMSAMRDEMRASTARLDERLAAVENLHRSSPPPLRDLLDMKSSVGSVKTVGDQKRIPTDVAHDFYRSGSQAPGGETDEEEDGSEIQAESETIRELKETNKRLLEMVGGFAEKIQALEMKMEGNA